jgi:TRAP-type mannitol/chloroaromatic compound transport system permease small subunit
MPPAVRWLITTIDTFTDWTGKAVAWLAALPLMFVVVYEVISRYFFNDPTIWAFDISYMLYGSLFMLGAAYALLHQGHIRTDMFYSKWSPRTQGLVDASLYLLIFFPGLLFFLLAGWQKVVHSWSIAETSELSPWRPILYPFRAVIPVAVGMLLLQGISEFVKAVYAVRWNRRP